MSDLTAKQDMFCREYIIDFNGVQAAIRAGYSEKGAGVQANRLLNNANISDRISELKLKREKETGITAAWVLKEAADSYKFNAQEVHDNDGNPKMVNAAAAAKFLEICGKHVDVKAFEGEPESANNAQPVNISFEVREPVKDVRVTRAKDAD